MRRTYVIVGIVCMAVAVILLVVLAILWSFGGWGSESTPCCDPAPEAMGTIDRHFMEQMIPHHEDAVAMAELALSRAEHPELKQLAETIIRDQTREIEQMRTWYRSWYGIDAPAGDGGFGGRDGGGGMMGGGMMNDEADLEALEAAPVFDKEFIEQMIPHHQMGVMMARMVLSRSDRPEIQDLARAIINQPDCRDRPDAGLVSGLVREIAK